MEVNLTRLEVDWLLKRALDANAGIKERPTCPEGDEVYSKFLSGIIEKMYKALDVGTRQ